MRVRTLCAVLLAAFAAAPRELEISIEPIGRYAAGSFNAESAEIAAFDPVSGLLFTTNIEHRSIDAISIRNPRLPVLAFQISLVPFGSHANSVAASHGIVAAAVENAVKTDPGVVVLFDTQGRLLRAIQVGSEPDQVTFSPDGRWLLVANEAEPNDPYTIDPEGSVTIVDLQRGPLNVTSSDVRTATFTAFNDGPLDPSIRIFGPRATVAQDLEPEYIAVSAGQ